MGRAEGRRGCPSRQGREDKAEGLSAAPSAAQEWLSPVSVVENTFLLPLPSFGAFISLCMKQFAWQPQQQLWELWGHSAKQEQCCVQAEGPRSGWCRGWRSHSADHLMGGIEPLLSLGAFSISLSGQSRSTLNAFTFRNDLTQGAATKQGMGCGSGAGAVPAEQGGQSRPRAGILLEENSSCR